MSFPAWFYLAAALLFSAEMTLRRAASRYLALVLSPLDEEGFRLCAHSLGELSQSWATASSSGAHEKSQKDGQKKLRKRKASEARTPAPVGTGAELWLGRFHERYEEFCNGAAAGQWRSEVRTMEIVDPRSSQLFRRVPLGMLISHAGLLEEREFALVLGYAAATGETWSSSASGERPLRGAALVFSLFDHLEEISSSLLDHAGESPAFISLMKSKTAGYLLRCVRELLRAHPREEDGGGEREVTMKDLAGRLARWRGQGGEAFEGCAAISDALDDISRI